jgi:hypothetical protein
VNAPQAPAPQQAVEPGDVETHTYPLSRDGGLQLGIPSGVLLIHRLTGTAVVEQSDRSQHRNREVALERLIALIATTPAPAPAQADDARDAALLDWLEARAHVEGRDGGTSSSYVLPHVPRSGTDNGRITGKPYYYASLRAALSAAAKGQEGVNAQGGSDG